MAPLRSNTRLQDPARAPRRGQQSFPSMPSPVPKLFRVHFLNNSRTTTHKGFFPFPSSGPSLSPGSTADWAAPAISNKEATVGKELTLTPSGSQPSPSTARQGNRSTERTGVENQAEEVSLRLCAEGTKQNVNRHEGSQAHMSSVARPQLLPLNSSTEPT